MPNSVVCTDWVAGTYVEDRAYSRQVALSDTQPLGARQNVVDSTVAIGQQNRDGSTTGAQGRDG